MMALSGRFAVLVGCMAAAVVIGATLWAPGARAREIHLDGLPVHCVSTGWGTPAWGRSIDGNPLQVNGEAFERGLGTHAHSELWLSLDGLADCLLARVGVDDEMAGDSPASIEFIVRGDGDVLWRSGLMRARQPAKTVDVPLAGVRSLVLEVTGADNGIGSDHGDWGNVRIVTDGAAPEAIWKQGEVALETLRELAAFQSGARSLTSEQLLERVQRIEKLYATLPVDDQLVRPHLDALADTGKIPIDLLPMLPPARAGGRREIALESLGIALVTAGYGSPHAGRSNGDLPLTINGRVFETGIGTHAESRMAVRLFGDAERLTAWVGVDDEVTSSRASIEFLVHGDGRLLWRSGVMGVDDDAKRLEVDLTGINELLLEVTGAGDGIASDHGDWCDAILTVVGAQPMPIPPTPEPSARYTDIRLQRPLDRLAVTWENARAMALPAEEVVKIPAADAYPGPVSDALPRLRRTVSVDLHVPFWHSTGLYAPPGEQVTVTVPRDAVDRDLKILIGCHTDTLWAKEHLLRSPRITRTFDVTERRTTVANAFGGLIYVLVPSTFEGEQIHQPIFWRQRSFEWVEPIEADSRPIDVTIDGAVEAPRYLHGVTDLAEWRSRIRHLGVPVAELESRKFVWSIDAKHVRDMDDPDRVMAFWDEVMDHTADLAGWPRDRVAPMRFVLDRQISVGGGHSGYPLMAYDNWSGSLDVVTISAKGTWGAYHEIGHNHQWSPGWTFQGQGEVTVNLFSLYCNQHMTGWKIGMIDDAPTEGWQWVTNRDRHREVMKTAFSRDPKVPGKWDEIDVGKRLLFHVQLIDAFGWDTLRSVIASYAPEANPEFPSSEEGRGGEYMVRFSLAAKHNLYPFFHGWGIDMPDGVEAKVKHLPVWMPEI